jgi:hypothetical protein
MYVIDCDERDTNLGIDVDDGWIESLESGRNSRSVTTLEDCSSSSSSSSRWSYY